MKKNLLLVLFGISLIVFASIRIASNNTVYYYTTTEAQEVQYSFIGADEFSERIKLGGFVIDPPHILNGDFGCYNSDATPKLCTGESNFWITDGNHNIEVIFDGFIPDLFQSDMGVILDGYFKHGVFYSDDMLVKHDNEYVSEDGETYNVENYSKWFQLLVF